MHTNCGVKIVRDDALPDDIEWLFVKTTNGELLLYLSQSASGCSRSLAEAWAAYRRMAAGEGLPVQRTPRRGVLSHQS